MSCSCGGSNENCMHCFGTGGGAGRQQGQVGRRTKSLSDEEVKDFLTKHPHLQPNPLQPPEGSIATHRLYQAKGQRHEPQSEELPISGLSYSASALADVRRGRSPVDARQSPVPRVTKTAKTIADWSCPSCHVKFRCQGNLRVHYCRKPVAPISPLSRMRGCIYTPPKKLGTPRETILSKAPNTKMTNCLHCGCPVKTTNLQKHFGKCPKNPRGHPDSSAREKSVQHARINKIRAASLSAHNAHDSAAKPKTVDLRTRRAQVNRRDPMDATKLYAFPCRENGKFGSHPLHDGMDDESGPD